MSRIVLSFESSAHTRNITNKPLSPVQLGSFMSDILYRILYNSTFCKKNVKVIFLIIVKIFLLFFLYIWTKIVYV